MKKLLFISSLLPLFSFAASQPLPAITDIDCVANYGNKGVYLVQSNEKTSQLTIVQQGKVVNTQQFNAAAYTCSLHSEHPVGYLGITGQPKRVMQDFKLSHALPEGVFAFEINPYVNIIKYWRQHPELEDSLIVTFENLQTGALVAEHVLPKDELRDTSFEFAADGKTMVMVYGPGNAILWHQDVKTLKNLFQIEFEDKIATSTRFLGNQLLTNFSGTVQLYQGQKLLWSYQHPDIVGKALALQVSPNQKLILLGHDTSSSIYQIPAFAILDRAGEALLTVTERLPLPDSENYRLLQLLDDGFVMKHTDDQHYRVYNLEQQVLRTFKLDRVDTLLPPPSIHQDFYRLSPTETPTGLRRQTLTLLQ